MLGWLPRPLIVAFRSLTKSGMVAFDAPPAPQHECSVRERRGGRRAARGCWSRGSGPRRRRHRTSAPYPGRRPRPACPRGSTSCPDATPGFGTGEQQRPRRGPTPRGAHRPPRLPRGCPPPPYPEERAAHRSGLTFWWRRIMLSPNMGTAAMSYASASSVGAVYCPSGHLLVRGWAAVRSEVGGRRQRRCGRQVALEGCEAQRRRRWPGRARTSSGPESRRGR